MRIELAFESNQHNGNKSGLAAVLDVLKEIHETDVTKHKTSVTKLNSIAEKKQKLVTA